MDIASIDTIPVEVPIEPKTDPWGLSPYLTGVHFADVPDGLSFDEARERVDDSPTVAQKTLIRIETDDGVIGWGEMNAPTHRIAEVIVEDLIAPTVIGQQVSDISSFLESFRDYPSIHLFDVTPMLGGVEIAMWDALGRTLDRPVYDLIGGKYREIAPAAYCVGILPTDEAVEHVRFAREHGFRSLKTKASRYWQEDVDRIRAMAEAAEGELDIRVDPNQQFTVSDATRFCSALRNVGVSLEYLEQPIRIDSFGHLKRLRERVTQPIAINEDAYFPRHVSQAIDADAIDAAVVDLIPSGGITGIRNIAAIAADSNVSLAHHSSFDLGIKNAAKLHVIASTPAFDLAMDTVYYALESDVLESPLELRDGSFEIPDRPGIAGDVSEKALETYRID